MARPRLKIDPNQVEELAAIDCSYEEIAAVVGCNPSTLTRRFAQAIKLGRLRGNHSLKRAQWTSAMGGNVGMLIWLGKQRLGQSDKVEQAVMVSETAADPKAAERALMAAGGGDAGEAQ